MSAQENAAKKEQRQVEALKVSLEKVKLHNALLKANDDNKRLGFMNGLSDLQTSAQYGGQYAQENITSWSPLINNNQYAVITLQYNTLMYMYSTHGIIQTAIDEPVLDAHRDPIGLSSKELSYRNLSELEQWLEENSVWEPFREVQIWGRLFGGAGLVVNVAGDPRKPMNLKELERGRFALYPATRWELGGTWRYSDTYNFYGVDFDKSRVMTVIGKRMPWIIERTLSGWGASLIARMAEDFNVFLRTRNVLYEILNEAKIDVYKLQGFNAQLTTAQGTNDTDRRIAIMNSLKSFHSAILLDSEDEFSQKQLSFAGMAQVMQENRIGVASAVRMPISKLFGTQAEGFSSGEDALENYNAMVISEVRKPARPLMLQLLKLGCAAVYGKEYHVDFEYPPLRVMGAKEEEEVKTSKQNRIIQQLEAGLIDEASAAAWAKHEKLIPIDTNLTNRGMKKIGAVTEDVPSRKAGKGEKAQGAKHERREGSGVSGDGRQVPKHG